MSNIPSEFQFPVTVYYEDTDAGGVVYHSNYLNFFERARTEMLRSKGINQRILLEQSTGFVVRHMDIDFIRGARLDDQLTVKTTIGQFKRASLTFLQEITDQHDVTIAKAVVKVACVDSSIMKPKAIPTPILTELKHSDG
ncbi:tol-pal system-associated acyl-CoA thioesterase [Vibrio hippocampi]|uniref:Acyl-CoA thioester hydrolase YbgC n=1 Tax=Vibrio hippocampi TaxID=654686 RepID=A0ABM8ZID8_9VIBR|nr:tol-pal system-associated acyl-CoA thioesterase [Vibrio hippocampi]CAH0526319.1 Acyl-CoA thioester hydrolase YbgC [Vibrio hippocampi]